MTRDIKQDGSCNDCLLYLNPALKAGVAANDAFFDADEDLKHGKDWHIALTKTVIEAAEPYVVAQARVDERAHIAMWLRSHGYDEAAQHIEYELLDEPAEPEDAL